jgi:uncharacterized protein
MKFNLDRAGGAHVVRAYAPGHIRIGDRDIATSVIVTAAELIEPWRPRRIAELEAADLEPVVALAPDVLLIGTGARQVFPAPALFAALHAARIGFEVMDTGAACRTYNVLVAEERRVAAALLIE